MQNIQDLKENIFFEFKNIVSNLEKIDNVEELISQQDLVEKLAKRVSFLKLLQENIENYPIDFKSNNDNNVSFSLNSITEENNTYPQEIIEEEALFNNKLNEIGEFENKPLDLHEEVIEEEVAFTNQLNEISSEETLENNIEEEDVVAEEDLLEADTLNTEILDEEDTEDVIVSEISDEDTDSEGDEIDLQAHQLDEIQVFENEITDEHSENAFSEEENIIPTKENEIILEEEFLDEEEEKEELLTTPHNDEIVSEYSTLDNIILDLKNEPNSDEPATDEVEVSPTPFTEQKQESEESLAEKKIKLSSIKKIKPAIEISPEDFWNQKIEENVSYQPNFSKTSDAADKVYPEFKLDLNDRMAFTKMLFGGSQTDLNIAISVLNQFKSLDEAKEYLSDLYYDRGWENVDEYAQRLWILVENKFL